MLKPGSTIGILGGGQLGRMMAVSAAQLGYRVHIFAPDEHSIAADVAPAHTRAAWDDHEALAAFADACDVITYEFENVPVEPLKALDQAKLAPGPRALEIAQDRMSEKLFVSNLGGAAGPFSAIDTYADFASAIAVVGAPGIIKTRRDGYDGKGQWRIGEDGKTPDIAVPQSGLIFEKFVNFTAEFSVILVRGRDGEVRFWDSTHNTHVDGILAQTRLPAPAIVASQVETARTLAQRIATELDYVGVLTCEFFATDKGPLFNEMAPRVHNSGHWSIEGAVTSQFENHIRAIAGLPLGDTARVAEHVVMDNLIGAVAFDMAKHLANPKAHLHLYGKAQARPGRKMGHITYVG